MKTQYATIHDGVIFQTLTAVKGSKHDFAMFKEIVYTFPEDLPHKPGITLDEMCKRILKFLGDSAYVGMDKIVSEARARVSIKRKPGKKLTDKEKAYNKDLASIRIRVEHAIRRVKAFRIMGDRYRYGTATREKNT